MWRILMTEAHMAQNPRKPLITLLMEQELVNELDKYTDQNRFRSRAQAMKFLIRQGMKQGIAPSEEQRELLAQLA